MPFGQPTSSGIALAPCAHAAHDRSTADRSKVRRSGSRRPVLAEGPAAASTDRHPRRHGELVCRRPGGATLPMSPTPRRVAATGQTRPCPVPPSRGPESRQSPDAGRRDRACYPCSCVGAASARAWAWTVPAQRPQTRSGSKRLRQRVRIAPVSAKSAYPPYATEPGPSALGSGDDSSGEPCPPSDLLLRLP